MAVVMEAAAAVVSAGPGQVSGSPGAPETQVGPTMARLRYFNGDIEED